MWLFTRYGFFSAVSARQGGGSHGQPVDLYRERSILEYFTRMIRY